MENESLELTMNRVKEMEANKELHTDGFYSADDLRILYREILRLRKELEKE